MPLSDGRIDELLAQGHAFEDLGDFHSALERYEAAIREAPGSARTFVNLGNALRALERQDEAIAAYRAAIEHDPAFAPANFNLALLLLELGQAASAEQALLECTNAQPGFIDAHLVLADLYEKQARLDEAETRFKRALDVDANHAGALLNYGTFCQRQGRLADASRLLTRARAADPRIKGVESSVLFSLNFRSDIGRDEIAAEHRRIGAEMERSAGARFQTWANQRSEERRLRVGYVSGDFYHHPVALFLRPILENHDRAAFEVTCYSNYADDNDVAQTLRRFCTSWHDISSLDDEAFVQKVRDDAIDVLVDLSGHTSRNRLSAFARHPTPVQATWLGYLNTTGVPAIDYRICDRHTDPYGESEHLHTERLVRMPDAQWCYMPWYAIPPIEQPHPTTPGRIVLGSFNQYAKISDECLRLWCEIVKEVPNAHLLVLDVRSGSVRDALCRRLVRNGIDADRVTFCGRESIFNYFAAIGNADIALDTFPYNGGTTTLDTLWMGVPLVALEGSRSIARGSYSILRTLGLDELIAHSEHEYVEINVRLARDRQERRRLRETLRQLLVRSPLMDAPSFTRALEQKYREMWRTWCATQKACGETSGC
jgi:predicted O-linked N-acetylglucosamine transferase (SPINDLY family)